MAQKKPSVSKTTLSYGSIATISTRPYESIKPEVHMTREYNGNLTDKQLEEESNRLIEDVDGILKGKVVAIHKKISSMNG